ncbi:hypothetical protein PLESTB_000921400 [Pleodorina starrii]|uniref:Uncharacterized protein n=1 Tax=Pleodorina starrii TaxID=330485 RepID=A0A9W6F3C5_9CHLO|nr:hypothetical protein PLESTB_000921400 [Pleodorina starrii]
MGAISAPLPFADQSSSTRTPSEQSSKYIRWERSKIEDLVVSEFSEGLAELSDSELMEVVEEIIHSRHSEEALALWNMVARQAPSSPTDEVTSTTTTTTTTGAAGDTKPTTAAPSPAPMEGPQPLISAAVGALEGLEFPAPSSLRWPWEGADSGTDNPQQPAAQPEMDSGPEPTRLADQLLDIRTDPAFSGGREDGSAFGSLPSDPQPAAAAGAATLPEPRSSPGEGPSVLTTFRSGILSLSQKLCATGEDSWEAASLPDSLAGLLTGVCEGDRTARALLSALTAGLSLVAVAAAGRGLAAALSPVGVLVGQLLAKLPRPAKDRATAERQKAGGKPRAGPASATSTWQASLWERARGAMALGGRGGSSGPQSTGSRAPPGQPGAEEASSSAQTVFPFPFRPASTSSRTPGPNVSDPRLRKLLDNGPPPSQLPGAYPLGRNVAASSSFGAATDSNGVATGMSEAARFPEGYSAGSDASAPPSAAYWYQPRQGDAPLDAGPSGQARGAPRWGAGSTASAAAGVATDSERPGVTPPDPWAAPRGP